VHFMDIWGILPRQIWQPRDSKQPAPPPPHDKTNHFYLDHPWVFRAAGGCVLLCVTWRAGPDLHFFGPVDVQPFRKGSSLVNHGRLVLGTAFLRFNSRGSAEKSVVTCDIVSCDIEAPCPSILKSPKNQSIVTCVIVSWDNEAQHQTILRLPKSKPVVTCDIVSCNNEAQHHTILRSPKNKSFVTCDVLSWDNEVQHPTI
jgi:hypothetical protein